MKIGVFDSGVGGKSVVEAIKRSLPKTEVIYENDSENVPYGNKTPDKLFELCLPKLQKLVDKGCGIIVVACNSVSVTILDTLKSEIKVPLIGTEPMLREGFSVSNNKVVAVCATPLTLKSKRYEKLREDYASGGVVVEPDCSEWAYMIENDQVDRARIRHTVEDITAQGADVIVLGCTHYHWIEELMESVAQGKAKILQPEDMIVDRLKKEISQLT